MLLPAAAPATFTGTLPVCLRLTCPQLLELAPSWPREGWLYCPTECCDPRYLRRKTPNRRFRAAGGVKLLELLKAASTSEVMDAFRTRSPLPVSWDTLDTGRDSQIALSRLKVDGLKVRFVLEFTAPSNLLAAIVGTGA